MGLNKIYAVMFTVLYCRGTVQNNFRSLTEMGSKTGHLTSLIGGEAAGSWAERRTGVP